MAHQQNPNSPLRDPERLAAEFGLPFKRKRKRWQVTETGVVRTSDAGKGDHRRDEDAEDRAKYDKGFQKINWKDGACLANDVASEPAACSDG